MWITDPKTKEKSVTLTAFVVSTLSLVGSGWLECFGHAKSTGPFIEMFVSTALLYLGRRVDIKSSKLSLSNSAVEKEP